MAGSGFRRLVLLGTGPANLQVLAQLAGRRPADLEVTLVSPYSFALHAPLRAGYVAGHYRLEQYQIPLEPLVRAAGARWIKARCTGLNAAASTVQLALPGDAGSETLAFDLLGIAMDGVFDRAALEAAMPGANDHALPTQPPEQFAALWPRVQALAVTRPLSVAVLGSDGPAVELVLAAWQCLQRSRFTLVTGGAEVAPEQSPAVRARWLQALKERNITVLRENCSGIASGAIQLAEQTSLACDVPIIALAVPALPSWLADSGLARDAQGRLLVDERQRSTSQLQIFAAGGVSGDGASGDSQEPPGEAAREQAGQAMASQLLAAARGEAPAALHRPRRAARFFYAGDRSAIAQWGPFTLQGRWAWRWKDQRDRADAALLRAEPPQEPPVPPASTDASTAR